MRKLIRASAGGLAVLFTVAVVATMTGASAPDPTLLDLADQADLGLPLEAIPANAPPARITAAVAIAIASKEFATDEDPARTLRALVPPDASTPSRSAYVVVYAGGPALPGGPVELGGKRHPTRYRGIVIDDQTGEVLRIFYVGE